MKLLPTVILALGLLLSSPGFAQTPAPAQPVAPVPAKPKALSSSDRSLAKDILETLYFLDSLSSSIRNKQRDEPDVVPKEAMTTANKLFACKNGVWGELAPLSMLSGDKLPSAISPKDKKKLTALAPDKAGAPKNRGKKDDKKEGFGPEWVKIMAGEAKELAANFEKVAHSLDPQMVQLNAKWGEKIKATNTEFVQLTGTAVAK